MSNLLTIGYVGIEASDLAAWKTFCVNFLGMQEAPRGTSDELKFRMDNRPYRIFVESGPLDDLKYVGWELINEQALEAYVRRLSEADIYVQAGDEHLEKSRQVKNIYFLQDPCGFIHEFYCTPAVSLDKEPFTSPVLNGQFVTGPLGFGHVTAMAADYQASQAFCEQVLGLNISDYMTEEVAPGVILDAVFYHSETGRHHSLAVGELRNIPLPEGSKRIDHLMVEVDNVDDVGLAYDRAKSMGIEVTKSLGRHPNDQMFSFYVRTPSGFQFEFGSGGVVVDTATWVAVKYDELSSWGHNSEKQQ